MIGIKAISSYIPKEGVDNFKQAETFEESASFVETKLGARFLPRLEQGDDTSDIAVKAVDALLCESDLAKEDIDALIVVTQNPDGQGLPHCAALVHQKLALPTHVAAFDVSLGCSGYVYGLSILQGFLAASGKKNGVLVTADPYSKVITTPNRTTSMLFGDAATATWMGENPQLVVSDCSFGTDGKGAEHLKVEQGELYMNGRQVFNFASLNVAPAIKTLLEKNDWPEESVDAFILHQGSLAIVDAIARRFKGSEAKFIKALENTGNTVSSSIPLILKNYLSNDSSARLVLSGFGVGFSWATCLLKRNEEYVN